MAKGNKNPNPATRFKPGVSGNPNGAPPLDPKLKHVKKLTLEEFELMAKTLMTASEEELEMIAADKSQPYIKRIVVQILKRAHCDGAVGTLDILLNRVFGKVKDKIEHTIMRPSILVRQDGSEVVFTNAPVKKLEEQ